MGAAGSRGRYHSLLETWKEASETGHVYLMPFSVCPGPICHMIHLFLAWALTHGMSVGILCP